MKEFDPLTMHRKAAELVLPVWRAMDWDSVSPRRRMGIYDEFQQKIRSAAHCATLTEFVSRLADKMGAIALSDPRVLQICSSGKDEELLAILREEAAIVVLLVRQTQEIWKGVDSHENL
jgi:hypothetical protein